MEDEEGLSLSEQLQKNFDNSPVAQQRATDRHNLNQAKIDKMNRTAQAVKGMKSNVMNPVTNATGVSTKRALSSSFAQDMAGDAVYTEQNQSTESPFASDYFNAKWMGFDFGAVTNKNTDRVRGIDPYSKAADWEDIRRNEQSITGALANQFTQFVSKTAINTVGGIVGGFYSLGAASVNGIAGTGDGQGGSAANLLYDNSVNRSLDKATDWVEQNNSTFTSEKHRKEAPMMGFLSFEGFKDVSDAFSFVGGAIASELIIDGFSGGTGLAGLPGRLGRAAGKVGLLGKTAARAEEAIGLSNGVRKAGKLIESGEDLAKTIGQIDINDTVKLQQLAKQTGMAVEDIQKYKKGLDAFSGAIKTGRGIVTGTFWEAGLEARHTKDEIVNEQMSKLDDFWSKQTDDWKTLNPDYYEKETKRINELASLAGQWTFGLNTAALGISNHIQFPTIFGGAEKSGSNLMSGKLTRKGLSDYVKNGGKTSTIIKGLGRALKSPITEGLEEMTQAGINIGSKNYYENMLGTGTSSSELTPGVANVSDAILAGVKSFGTESSIKEGLVGALVGAMGFPMLRRNSKGKLRPTVEGGLYEGYKEHKSQNRAIEDSIADLNLNKFDTLLSYNKDNAIVASIDAKSGTIAELNGDKFEKARLQDNVVFRHVRDRMDKGLESYMNQDVQDIKDMSLEDYKAKFKKDEDFSQSDKDSEANAFADKVKIYSDAYKKVYKGLRMDVINNNQISKKLFDTLTYAVATEKILSERQKILNDRLLSNPNLNLTAEELNQLSKLTGKYKDHQHLINNYVEDKLWTKAEKINKKLDDLNIRKNALIESVGSKYEGYFDSSTESLNFELEHESAKENHVRNDAKIAALQKIITEQSNYKQLENDIKQAEIEQPSFDVSKSKTARDLILEKIKANVERQSSASLDLLRNKKDTVTHNEIEQYLELKDKAQEGIKQTKLKQGLSFLDSLTDEDVDIQNTLDELANITKHQTQALEVATNIYGFNDTSKAYEKIANAQFLSNLENLQNDIIAGSFQLTTKDDEDYMAQLIQELTVNIKNVKDDFDEFGQMITEDISKLVKEKLEHAEDVLNSLQRYLNNQDEKDEIAAKTAKEIKEKATEDLMKGVDNNQDAKEEEDNEVKEEINGNVNNAEFSNETILPFSSKNLHTISLKDPKNPQQLKLKEDVNSGKVKYNSAVVATNKEENESTEEFNSYLKDGSKNKTGKDISVPYNSGKAKVVNNPELLKKQFDQLDGDVKIYIAHAPVEVKIYDKQVKISEGKQSFTVDSNTPVVSEFLYFSPTMKSIKGSIERLNDRKNKVLKKYKAELAKLNNVPVDMKTATELLEIRQTKLDEVNNTLKGKAASTARAAIVKQFEKPIQLAEANDARDKSNDKQIIEQFNRDKAILDERLERAIQSLKEEVEIVAESKNDKVLFTFRQSLLYNKHTGNNELKMRLGNINNGYLEKSAVGIEVGEYGLTPIDGNDNYLIDDINSLNADDFMFGNQLGEYRSVDDDRKIVKLNTGSNINKTNAINARIYLKYKTINGQNIPVALNRAKLGSNKAVYDEILFQLEEYIKKGKDGIISTLNDKSGNLDFLKGKSYEAFFKTFMDQSNHGNRDDNSLGTLTISKKDGSVMTGTQIIPVGSDIFTNKEKENELKTLKDNIAGMRFYLDIKSLRNSDGSFNNEFMQFIVRQKLLNHDFNTMNNNDKIFERDMNGEPFNKSIQFHLLNTEAEPVTKVKSKATYKDLSDALINTLNIAKDSVIDFASVAYGISGLVIDRAIDKYEVEAGKKSKVKIVKEAFNEIIAERKAGLLELAKLFPTQYTENLDIRNNPDIKSNEKIIDKFLKYLFKYGKEIGKESMFNKMAGHLQNKGEVADEIAKDVDEKMTLTPGIPSGPVKIDDVKPVQSKTESSDLDELQKLMDDLVKSTAIPTQAKKQVIEKAKVTKEEAKSVSEMLSGEIEDDIEKFDMHAEEVDIDAYEEVDLDKLIELENKAESKKSGLTLETKNWIKDNGTTLNLRIKRWIDKNTDKQAVKDSLSKNNINNYNDFKSMLNILYKNRDELIKMLTFAEKVFDTKDNDKLNCK